MKGGVYRHKISLPIYCVLSYSLLRILVSLLESGLTCRTGLDDAGVVIHPMLAVTRSPVEV